jgi:hypothetical protein
MPFDRGRQNNNLRAVLIEGEEIIPINNHKISKGIKSGSYKYGELSSDQANTPTLSPHDLIGRTFPEGIRHAYSRMETLQKFHNEARPKVDDYYCCFLIVRKDIIIWPRPNGNIYEYVAANANDLATKYSFKLKGIRPITFHLGMHIYYEDDGTLCTVPRKCIEHDIDPNSAPAVATMRVCLTSATYSENLLNKWLCHFKKQPS